MNKQLTNQPTNQQKKKNDYHHQEQSFINREDINLKSQVATIKQTNKQTFKRKIKFLKCSLQLSTHYPPESY